MMSSDGFGGGAAGARPRVQICSATRAESGTVVPAQQKVTRYCQRQLFADHWRDIDARRPGRQRVKVGIVSGLGVTGEHRRRDVNVHFLEDLAQAPAALAAHHRVNASSPEVLSLAGRLKLAIDEDITHDIEIESLEGRIVSSELPFGTDGTALQVPNIHSQHSRLK
jgi:hypothetical protein